MSFRASCNILKLVQKLVPGPDPILKYFQITLVVTFSKELDSDELVSVHSIETGWTERDPARKVLRKTKYTHTNTIFGQMGIQLGKF